jgi:hypothetical protein
VRRDEAKAAEEEKATSARIKVAEREARTGLLRQRARERVPTNSFIPLSKDEVPSESNHINFFRDVEDGVAEIKSANKEHEAEVKQEKEKYEKQIGYLTYLGQDTNEALGKRNWYDEMPDRTGGTVEVNLKSKMREDPLRIMKKFVGDSGKQDKKSDETVYKGKVLSMEKESKKQKNYNEHSDHKKKNKRKYECVESDSDEEREKLEKKRKLENLRMERLKREKEERRRSEDLLAKLKGETAPKEKNAPAAAGRKYNNQFNPEIAKQNYKYN